jgi:hypothetical protein
MRREVGLGLTVAIFGTIATTATAQPYDIAWHAIKGGGTPIASGGPYTITGTAGQQDAGPTLVGGPYTITGGFWVAWIIETTTPRPPRAGNPGPSITITTPTGGPALSLPTPTLTINGVASDSGATAITRIIWTNNRGGHGIATGTTTWSIPGLTLFPGTNIITITAIDANGNNVTATLTVTLTARTYYLAEGATGSFFESDIALANPNPTDAPIVLTFYKPDGSAIDLDDTLPALSRKTIVLNTIPGLESVTGVSTRVTSPTGTPVIVERTMSWDQRGYGAHTEKAADTPALRWYFAEGSQGFFHTYLLLVNPSLVENVVTVEYLRESEPSITRTYTLAPASRMTVDAGADPDLTGRSFGMVVTFDQPGMAERAMYFGTAPLWSGGTDSAGETAPSTTWFLAEGATGPFFETFLLLANPNDTDVTATLTYLPASGFPLQAVKRIAAHARLTVNIEGEAPELANTAVSTQVVASQPILVERSQYWPDPAPRWHEAHNSFGVTASGTKWGLAEGRVGGANHAQTYILLANPGTTAATVTITFLRDHGLPTVTKTFSVKPTSRFNVAAGPGTDVPELKDEQFGALVTSDQPIAVERALYWDANGQTWAAGTNATATRLP